MESRELFEKAKSAIETRDRILQKMAEDAAGLPKSPSFDSFVKGGTVHSPMDAVDSKIDRENRLNQGILKSCEMIIDCAWDLLDEIAKHHSYECEQVVQQHWMEGITWEMVALKMGYKTRDRAYRKADAAFGWADLHFDIAWAKSGQLALVRLD